MRARAEEMSIFGVFPRDAFKVSTEHLGQRVMQESARVAVSDMNFTAWDMTVVSHNKARTT